MCVCVWGGGGGCDNKWRKTRGRERAEWDEGDHKVKNKRVQLPPKRCNVFCLVKLVWQSVPEDGCSITE